MKAMKSTNRTNRVLTTVMILTMAAATGYAQGLLAEGAMKLFDALTNKNTTEQSIFHQAKYAGQAKEVAEREFNAEVVRSFNVEAVDITFEKEVTTESWMTESFSGNGEAGVSVEEWMTAPISASLETPVTAEAWMTVPMSADLEAPVTVEAWMTAPMGDNLEAPVVLEAWMTAPISEELEADISAEGWMSTPLYASVENAPEVEDWMTTPLLNAGTSEEPVQLESWMTETLR